MALLIDRAIVKWVKGSEFGVDFNTLQPKAVEQITTVISTLVKTDHDSSRNVSEAGRRTAPPKLG